MKKISVIQILPTLNTGGVERGVLDFNKYLVANGHRSIVISDGGRQVKNLIEDGGEHVHLPISKKSIFTLLQARQLARVINELSPDIVHIRSRVPAWVLQLSKLFLKNPRPVIFSTFHGLYSTPFYSRIMASFDHVIAISKTVEKYVVENYSDHLIHMPRMIYRGSDSKYFNLKFNLDDSYKKSFFEKFPELTRKKILTFPGRLSSWKGQESFIKLLSELPKEYAGLIVGPYLNAKKKYIRRLKSLINNYGLSTRVFFYDAKNDIRNIYSMSEIVFNLSTKPEPFGRTILEAAMMGRKICGWNRGGVGEVLNMFYPQGNIEFGNFNDLVKATQEICENDAYPKNIFLTSDLMHEKTMNYYFDALESKLL